MGAADLAVAEGLTARIERLVGCLRAAGAPVRPADVIDAMAAVRAVDLGRRAELRVALQATLVKHAHHVGLFGRLFDACFPAAVPAGGEPDLAARGPATPGLAAADAGGEGGAGGAAHAEAEGAAGVEAQGAAAVTADDSVAALRDRLVDALARDDTARLAALAREVASGSAVAGERGYRRATHRLGVGSLVQDAVRRARAAGHPFSPTATTAAVDRFLRALRDELLARRMLESAGSGGVAPLLPDPLDVDIAGASVVDQRDLRAALRPLARRLAARLHQARHPRRGALDMRRTLRRSLGAGGIPIDTLWRRRRPHHPDLWLLCDVSGSVAAYARFTVGLAAAAHDEIPRLRVFLFVDEPAEVTPILRGRRHEIDAFALVGAAAVRLGGRRSDWGRALRAFEDRFGGELGPRTTILVTGDGRSHGADPAAPVVERLCRRVGTLSILVPEPRHRWGTGDSALAAYAAAGAGLHEVRTLAQLARALEAVLAGPPAGHARRR